MTSRSSGRDDVIVAVALGAGLQRGEVRSGVRLGIALGTSGSGPAAILADVLLLLRLVAVLQQRRPEHPDAEARQRRARPLPTSPRAAPCARRGRALRRHIPSASPARSSLVAHPLEPDALRLGRELCVTPAPIGVVSEVIGRRISGGQLASSQARVSRRNVSRSDMMAFPCGMLHDLSRRIAEFNICLTSAHAARTVVMTPDRVYAQSRND